MTQTKPIVSIENVVASASVDQAIDLSDVTKKFPETELILLAAMKNQSYI